jgi:hypothetical protein
MSETVKDRPGPALLRLRLALVACAVVLLGAALSVGISDNPPGILLAFLSSIALVAAFAVALRTKRQFAILLLGSLLCFVGAAILHNVFEAAASVAGVFWLRAGGEAAGAAFFLAAVLLCPAGAAVGLVGVIAAARRRPPADAF